MRKFKTICHNNQYRNCGVTPDQRELLDGKKPPLSSRPTSSGTIMTFKMDKSFKTDGRSPLIVGKEYIAVSYGDTHGYSILDEEGSIMYLTTEDEMILVLQDDENIMGIRFDEFFYTEEQLRENKINKILD